MYGGGDIGLPEYNPERILEIIKYVWWDVSATGFLRPSGINGLPLFGFLSLLQKIGFSFVQIQMFVFYLCMLLMGLGMYYIAKKYVKSKYLPYLAGIYYILNPYMMIQIWHRFVRPAFYLAALLPFFFLLWEEWVKKGRLKAVILFGVLSFIFSFIFSTLGFIFTFWLFLFSYLLYQIFFPWKDINWALIISVRGLSAFLVWLSVQVWWLYPFFSSAPSLFSSQHSAYENLSNLIDLSNKSQIQHVISGINPFYLIEQADFGMFYTNPIILVLPFVTASMVMIGMVVALRNSKYVYWSLLLVFAVFVSKGSASPFGYLYIYLFENIFVLGVIRNTFEKLGILIPFSSSILFIVAFEWIFNMKKSSLQKILRIWPIIAIFSLVIFAYPILSGKIFGKHDSPPYVSVPDNYVDANNWLEENSSEYDRILHLPITKSDGIIYDWEVGYRGLEPSDLLFSNPSIAHFLGSDFLDAQIEGIEAIFQSSEKLDEELIESYLSNFGIKYIVVHNDVDWVQSRTVNPEIIENRLQTSDIFRKVAEFDSLIIYLVECEIDSKIHFVKNPIRVSLGRNTGINPYYIANNRTFISSVLSDDDNNLSEKILSPFVEINLPFVELSQRENAIQELTQAKHLPESIFYPIVLLKEKFQYFANSYNTRFWMGITIADKRLSEVSKLATDGNLGDEDISRYEKYVNYSIDEIERMSPSKFSETDILILRKFMSNHTTALGEIIATEGLNEKQQEKLGDIKNYIASRLARDGIIPVNSYTPGTKVFLFDIAESDDYKIYLTNENKIDRFDDQKHYKLLVDGEERDINFDNYNSQMLVGDVYLDEGLREIGYENKLSSEISGMDEYNNFTLSTNDLLDFDQQRNWVIDNFDNSDRYLVTFDYWIKNGLGPHLQIIQDSDPYDPKDGKYARVVDSQFYQNDYNFYWQHASFEFEPRDNANNISVNLEVLPWNNCLRHLGENECEDKTIASKYNRDSDVEIRNFSIRQIYDENILLSSSGLTNSEDVQPVVFEKINPTHYSGKINYVNPGYLIFSETYHPDWTLKLRKNGELEIIGSEYISNLHSNGWFLNDTGEYDFELSFKIQDKVNKGIYMSVLFTLISLFIVFTVARITNAKS